MTLPSVTTVAITGCTLNGFTVHLTINSLGDSPVTDRGFVWGASPSPTLDNWSVHLGGTDELDDDYAEYPGDEIQPDTTYYVRAFATNGSGTAYGAELTFNIALALPTLRLLSISSIVPGLGYSGQWVDVSTPGFTYTLSVDDLGDKLVTAHGIVWGTEHLPDLTGWYGNLGTKSSPGEKTKRYAGTVLYGETYYVRAYATNSLGTAYSEEISFEAADTNFEWVFVATPDHSQLENLNMDDHFQYLTEGRHDITDRHTLGTVVPHDDHSKLTGLTVDGHPHYLTVARHDLKARHTPGVVVPYMEPLTNGDAASPELLFDDDGDLIHGEVI